MFGIPYVYTQSRILKVRHMMIQHPRVGLSSRMIQHPRVGLSSRTIQHPSSLQDTTAF